MQALLQQQRVRQHQQMLQSMSPSQRLQLQKQQQLRQQLQQQGTQQISPNVRPYEVGVCARKLMMYLYHLQQRPANTSHLVQSRGCACHSTKVLGTMPLACFHRQLRICGSVIFAALSLERDLVR
jgi:hypothetical protein